MGDRINQPRFEDEKDKPDFEERRPGGRRKRLIGAAIFFLMLIVAGAGLWMIFSGGVKTRVNVPVRDSAQRTDQAASGGDDATAAAIAEVRSATASPTPAASASPAPGTIDVTGGNRIIDAPATPVTIPIEGVGDAVSSPATETGSAAKTGGVVSERNPERSIRCAPAPVAASTRQLSEASPKQPIDRVAPVIKRPKTNDVALPPFGSMLPIRTMGALYTLRAGLARFELTHDVRGQGWQMRKGTTLIGQQQGGEYDRAYVSLVGFIDPESKRFVKVNGEELGADGAPGLKGKRICRRRLRE